MTRINYNKTPRKNLELYWQQFYPQWKIPKGYHVHHIKPKCTYVDPNNPRIHHPSNLIALSRKGYKHTEEAIHNMQKAQVKSAATKQKLSDAHKGKAKSKEHAKNISSAKKGSTWKLVNGKRVWDFSKKDKNI